MRTRLQLRSRSASARTDVAGVVLPRIGADEADRLLAEDLFEGGIVPKLRAAVDAARGGVRAEIGMTEVVA